MSNGQPVDDWGSSLGPSVYLAVIAIIANTLLAVALAEGLSVLHAFAPSGSPESKSLSGSEQCPLQYPRNVAASNGAASTRRIFRGRSIFSSTGVRNGETDAGIHPDFAGILI
ncbi:MAG: hypothetical protein Q9204_007661 [Flavoplaca sp. TL-2023a]